jgi:hypothetical protein
MTTRHRVLWHIALLALVATGVAACSGTPTAASPSTPVSSTGSVAASPTPTPSPTPAARLTPTPKPTPTVAPARVVTHPVYIARVRVGQCFNNPKSFVNGFVSLLTTCAAPHDNQMMGSGSLGKGPWPGQAAADARADAVCTPLF